MTRMKGAPLIRRSVAAALLQVTPTMLDELEIHCWKEGRVTFYDPGQIGVLLKLRKQWLKNGDTVAR